MIKAYTKNDKKLYEVYVATRNHAKKLIAKRKRNIPSERKAREIEFEFKKELKLIASSSPSWTWALWLEECLKRMRVYLKVSTTLHYEGRLKKWVPLHWQNRKINSFSVSDITDLLHSSSTSANPVSQKHLLKLVRRIFQLAVDEGLIAKNPTAGIKVKHVEHEKKVLTAKEAEILLLNAIECNHPFYPIWAFALKTGMRSGEMYALKWSDIDFESNIISVTKQWTNKVGFTSTKTRENRVVPISTDLKEFLLELTNKKKHENEFLLPHLSEWTNGDQAFILKKFCRVIGITEVKFHDLRATFITNLLSQGVPLVKVMAIVGHKKMSTTDIYLRLAGVEIKGATEQMGFQIPQSNQGAKVFNFPKR